MFVKGEVVAQAEDGAKVQHDHVVVVTTRDVDYHANVILMLRSEGDVVGT